MSLLRMAALSVALLAPVRALADSDSLFALGVGTAIGVNHSGQSDPGTTTLELKARLRLLRGLGLELAYDPTVSRASRDLGVVAVRGSALLHVIPTYPLGAYLKGGVGAQRLTGLLDATQQSSYHAGFGLELHVADHLVVAGEYFMLFPALRALGSEPGQALGPGRFRVLGNLLYFF
jgi:hypothetical protein